MHRDLLGFLDHLLHAETLLLSDISREDGELMELDAVLEGQPRPQAKAFVRLTIHANPRVLAVHLVYNLLPLHLHLANNKTMEQLVRLRGLHYPVFAGGLEVFLDHGERFSLLISSAFVLPSGALRSSFNCLLTSTTT